MDQKAEETVVALGEGNQGALSVCVALHQAFGCEPLELLGKLGIKGREIWLLFKYACGQNLQTMHQSLIDESAIEKLRKLDGPRFDQTATPQRSGVGLALMDPAPGNPEQISV